MTEPSVLSVLCQRCGLCCDGTLFGTVRLEDGEAARLGALGLPAGVHPDGGARLHQPCAALVGQGCAVYPDRPNTCRRFICLLGQALEAKEVTLSEALVEVEATRALEEGPLRQARLRRLFLGRQGAGASGA